MTSKYMSFSPQLVNERNAALNNCPTKSGRSQIYKNYYIKMKAAYKKHEEEIEAEEDYEDDEEDDDEEDEDDEDYEPSEDEEYEEEYEASEADTSACETEADTSACETEDEEYDACECEQEVPDQDANKADQEYCCCCEAAYACETEAASEAEASEAADEAEASEADEAEASEAEEADEEEEENEFGCPGCNYEWRDGYKTGWREAMKYIAGRTHKEVPDTLACSYCDIVCKTRKCSGKCGGVVRYCSVDCQKQDWAFGHKNICGK